MKIFVDARCVRPRRSGVGWATDSLVCALAARTPPDQIFALTLRRSPLENACLPNLHLIGGLVDYEWHPLAELYEDWYLPRAARRLGVDVFWGPAFVVPARPTPFPRVVSIFDLTMFDTPAEYPMRFGAYMRWQVSRSVRCADAVICPSEYTRRRLVQRWPYLEARSHVVPLAVAAEFLHPAPAPAPQPPLPARFVLTVGGGLPRKNAAFGAEIVARLRDNHKLPIDYVVVGEDQRLPPWVHQYPLLPRPDLVPFYQRAELLLMPSTDEGFGIPALEAMACGCPVAVSDRGALPEVVGDAAALIFSLSDDPAQIADRLAATLRDTARLEECRTKGRERAHHFTWEKSAQSLRNVFETVARR
jgi:glycosyltransferase involved in cell wall biosynthesis